MNGGIFITSGKEKYFYVYVLRNHSGSFYIGITSDLVRRLWEHQNKVYPGFTEKYNIDKLVYYETYYDPEIAISREKQLKNWNRKKKIELIVKENPKFEEIKLSDLI